MSSNFQNGFEDGLNGGVSIRGMRILNTYSGNVFHVNSNGSTSGEGTRLKPFATVPLAVANNKVTANDTILVAPGHVETISEAAGWAISKAGLNIIGLGNGTSRPTVTLDTAITADIDIDAANVTIQNMIFSANFADITAAIDVNATDFTMQGCRFQETAVDMNALIWIQDAAAVASNRISIEGCEAIALDAANTHFINFAGTPDNCRVIGNDLIGDWGTMAIGGAGIVTNVIVRDNTINNASTTVDACINFAATATGTVMRNLCGGGAAQANGVTATACAIAENYYGVNSEDLSAILDPIAT
jgi:hypothetical protein